MIKSAAIQICCFKMELQKGYSLKLSTCYIYINIISIKKQFSVLYKNIVTSVFKASLIPFLNMTIFGQFLLRRPRSPGFLSMDVDYS